MIKINLLPPELQDKKAMKAATAAAPTQPSDKTIQLLTVLAALVAVVIVVGVGYGYMYRSVSKAKADEKQARASFERLEKTYNDKKDRFAEQYAKWSLMQNQLEIMAELMPENRIIWSEKLNMLSNMMPPDIYVTGIQIEEDVEMVETEESKKEREKWEKEKRAIESQDDKREKDRRLRELGDEPEVIKKPLITQTLTIEAATLLREDGSDRIAKVIELSRRMQTYEMVNAEGEVRRFRDFFKQSTDPNNPLIIDTRLMEAQDIHGVGVWTFNLILTTAKPKPAKITEQEPS